MGIDPFTKLKDEACREAYEYFDRRVRPLPKNPDGRIDESGLGLDDNDVDAFRHAYVSGVFTQKYGERTANILGLINEYSLAGQYSHSMSPRSRNMDFWNNRVGRKYGKRTRGRKTLLKLIHKALIRGELFVDLNDGRKYKGASRPPKRISKPLIVLRKTSSGRNEIFYDLQTRAALSRSELIVLIRNGRYPGYSIKIIKGVETPVSKRDGRRINNIG